MTRHILFCAWAGLSFLFVVSQLFAQPPDSLWSRTYGGSGADYSVSVQQTSDGGYILVGSTTLSGNRDAWAIKTDKCGNVLWTRTWGGPNPDVDEFLCVQQTSDGGYVLVGYTYSFGAGAPTNYSAWLLKTDASGDTLWSHVYGGGSGELWSSVQQLSDDSYVVAGRTYSYGAGSCDFWLMKTTVAGDSLWSRTFGGASFDQCNSVQQSLDDGYVLAGSSQSFGAGSDDFWLVKTDSNGVLQWDRTYGGIGSECCYSVRQTSDGGYILAGATNSFGAGGNDFWMVKTGGNGDSLWSRTFGGPNDEGIDLSRNWGANCVRQTSDGGYIMAGWTKSYGVGGSDFWLVKTDSLGDSLWSRTFGGGNDDYCWSAQPTSDNGYVLAGNTYSYGAVSGDVWLVKTGYSQPNITSITDVGNDQGRQARIRWNRCAYDECPSAYTITSYSIYRRIDQYLAGGTKKAERESLDWPPGEWEYIKTVPARGEAQYATIVPTLADSTSEGIYWSVFFVSAETANPLVYFDSGVDSGYSIDNLPPDETLLTAMAQPAPGYIHLQWQEVTTGGEGQLEQGDIWYRIYGSTDPMFTPGAGNLLGVTQSLEFTHEVGTNQKYFYIIQASDDH